MNPAISTALQRCGCDYQQVKIPLDDLNDHFQDDWTNAALHCISQASSRPNFVTALARIAKTLIHNNTHTPSHPSTKPSVQYKIAPSTLGFYFKYNCCSRYLRTSCSISKTSELKLYNDHQQVGPTTQPTSFLSIKSLLVERGFCGKQI